MPIEVLAPFETPIVSMLLPDPDLGNIEQPDTAVIMHKLRYASPPATKTNQYFTYKRSTGQKILQYTFNHLTFSASQKLLDFFKLYSNVNIKLTDHHGDAWKAVLITDALSITEDSRAYPQTEDNTTVDILDNFVTVSISFLASRVY